MISYFLLEIIYIVWIYILGENFPEGSCDIPETVIVAALTYNFVVGGCLYMVQVMVLQIKMKLIIK